MKWLSFLLNRKIVVILMVFLILLIGAFTIQNLNIEMLPKAEFDGAGVFVNAGQASSVDIDLNVVQLLEKKIADIDGVESYFSVSSVGQATINVRFEQRKGDSALTELEQNLQGMETELALVDSIDIYRDQLSSTHVLFMDIFDGQPDDMSQFAEHVLMPRLENLREVGDIRLYGITQKEVIIELNREKLQAKGLEPSQVMNMLQQENRNIALGKLEGEDDHLLRWDTSIQNIEDVEQLFLNHSNEMIELKDIASVYVQEVEGSNEAWKNGQQNFISVQIAPANNVTETAMTTAVRNEVEHLKEEGLVQNFELEEMMATADFIQNAVNNVKSNIYIGAVLAFFIILLFLRNLRATIIIGISIPLSILLTFITMGVIGYSINLVTLISLGLAIGMMVDAAIVIFEAIYKKRQDGLNRYNATVEGTKEVGGAVIAAMLTTIVVFLPIGMVSDPFLGTLVRMMSIMIVITLVTSVLVSFTVIPILSHTFLKVKPSAEDIKPEGRLISTYGTIIAWITGRKWRRWIISLCFAIAFAFAILLVNKVPTGVIPDVYDRQSEIVVWLDQGTTPEEREAIVLDIDKVLYQIPDVKGYNAFANRSTIYMPIQMTPAGDATMSQQEVNTAMLTNINELAEDHPITTATLSIDLDGPGGGSPIVVMIKGHSINTLVKLADELEPQIEEIAGITSTRHSMDKNMIENMFRFDHEEIKSAGLMPSQIRDQLGLLFTKLSVGELQLDGSNVPIIMQTEKDISNNQELLNTWIQTPLGPEQLKTFVSINEVEMPIEIRRNNGEKYISIMADKDETDLGTIGRAIDQILADYDLPVGYSYSLGGQLQQQQETGNEMMYVLLIAVFLVYMVMAVQFNHFAHPLVVMSVIPMAMIGAIVGLFLTQRELNLMSAIGILMLVGIILNNAILLIDRTKQLRKQHLSINEALIEAGKNRLRPILMTTLTTVFGMLPLALATGSTSNFQTPMATAVISGLLFATLITLVLVPSVYMIFEDIFGWPKRMKYNKLKRKALARRQEQR